MNFRTNLPMRLMNFPDYVTMGLDSEAICCGSHEQVHSYLEDYANHFNIQQFIQVYLRLFFKVIKPKKKISTYIRHEFFKILQEDEK